MAKAFDASNYTGKLSKEDVELMRSWDVTHAMIGTQNVDIAKAQLDTWYETAEWTDENHPKAKAPTSDLYVQFDANYPALPQLRRAEEVFAYEELARTVYIAIEQIASPWKGTPAEYQTKLDEALVFADGLALPLVGIYTSYNQWTTLMVGASAAFIERLSRLPLWYANYDHSPVLDAVTWRKQGFGPWWQPKWKQYEAGPDGMGFVLPSGRKVDFSVSAS